MNETGAKLVVGAKGKSCCSIMTLKPESAQSFAHCLHVRGYVDPGYCAGFETGGVSWMGVRLYGHLASWMGLGGRGVQLGVHSRHLAVPTHTKCLGLIVPFIQIRKLRPREG